MFLKKAKQYLLILEINHTKTNHTKHTKTTHTNHTKSRDGTGYTGARWTGLALMNAAHNGVETEDGTFGGGNQFFAELSSVNPVYFLPGALKERLDECVDEFVESNLLGVGQFCTNPGIVVLQEGDDAEACKSRPQNTWVAAPEGFSTGQLF